MVRLPSNPYPLLTHYLNTCTLRMTFANLLHSQGLMHRDIPQPGYQASSLKTTSPFLPSSPLGTPISGPCVCVCGGGEFAA